ncbi:hypothetical protein EPD60_16570 [Flaviaesturariibacter flavus]|uniref:DUF3868 domain-containing protein n=1 Tax=Flaviaesturariibacter flavus TaxID=2502780 RepID=A0A4R1B3X5_9BACT|nr:hypothetical protein [Flaviaesturariibacter flavus]TCJ12160.1 hypothetical protein EPD60_16570 [Flaviaesturariibacter flavus]
MKNLVAAFAMAILLAFAAQAQEIDTVRVQAKVRRFQPDKYYLITYETGETVDSAGKTLRSSRSYFFDKKERMLHSVRESSNAAFPRRGTQVVYDFWKNRLTKVNVTPPASDCRNCASEYFFEADTLWNIRERGYRNALPRSYAARAAYFRSRVPVLLEWGYFGNEHTVNGRQETSTRRSY